MAPGLRGLNQAYLEAHCQPDIFRADDHDGIWRKIPLSEQWQDGQPAYQF